MKSANRITKTRFGCSASFCCCCFLVGRKSIPIMNARLPTRTMVIIFKCFIHFILRRTLSLLVEPCALVMARKSVRNGPNGRSQRDDQLHNECSAFVAWPAAVYTSVDDHRAHERGNVGKEHRHGCIGMSESLCLTERQEGHMFHSLPSFITIVFAYFIK